MLTVEQRAMRSGGIGASESPAVMGVDPYRSPMDIYLKKLGLVEDVETHHTERGTFLEPGLRAWASKRLGLPFVEASSLVHPEFPHVMATPDGVARDGSRVVSVLELKSPGPRTWHEWGDGDDEVPDRYVVQCAQQMAVTGAEVAHLVALVDGDIRCYRIGRDRDLECYLLAKVESFWRDHVATQTPPPVDGSGAADAWLSQRFPRDTTPVRIASDAEAELLSRFAELRQASKEIQAELDLIGQRVKAAIGDAGGVEAAHVGKATWKSVKGRTAVNWQAVARHLGATRQHEAKFTETGPGHRALRWCPAKER